MKDLRPIKGKFYLERLIAEGEHLRQDFKFAISDARKIARSISAFANHAGGRLLIGVKDNGVIAGVRNEEDIYVVEQAAHLYCRPSQNLEFKAFKADEGLVVIQASVEPSSERPVQACDTDGQWKTYYRIADENILATPLMVRAWQRKSSGESIVFTLSEVEKRLLSLLETSDCLTVEQLMNGVLISRQRCEDLLTRLYALDVIDFRFVGRKFAVCLADS